MTVHQTRLLLNEQILSKSIFNCFPIEDRTYATESNRKPNLYPVPAVLIPVLRLCFSFSSYSPAYQSLNELAYLAFEEGNGDLSPLAINIGSWEKGQDAGVPGRMKRGTRIQKQNKAEIYILSSWCQMDKASVVQFMQRDTHIDVLHLEGSQSAPEVKKIGRIKVRGWLFQSLNSSVQAHLHRN